MGNDKKLEFDLSGIDSSIANALRRLMISEVPTMAIENVFILNNSSVIHDEMLAHRLGLVPITADPKKFDYPNQKNFNETNTIVFQLAVLCKKKFSKLENEKVFSGDLEWLPNGSKIPSETNCRFSLEQTRIQNTIQPAQDNILLAILIPGQEIFLEAHCVKGKGQDHAKWSPVATQWYRLLSEIVLIKELEGNSAKELAQELPGLVGIDTSESIEKAVIKSARENEQIIEKCRRLVSENKWFEFIQLRKVKGFYVFTIESTGSINILDIFTQAVDLLISKIDDISTMLKSINKTNIKNN